jgi:hypothetical protein
MFAATARDKCDDPRMRALMNSLPWFGAALAAMLAAYEGIDLRLIAVLLCGIAVLAGSGVLDGRRSDKP